MEIGKHKRTYTVEPVRDPIPAGSPEAPKTEPQPRQEPAPVPVQPHRAA